MDFSQLIKVRQSVRGYTDQPVPPEHLEACLEAARMAPSACNSQPWKFIVVDQKDKVAEIAQSVHTPELGINKFASSVPVFVVLVQEEAKLMKGAADRVPSDYWADFDNGAAVAYFCLQAAELGLGTCVMGSYQADKIRTALNIPEPRMIRMVIALGYGESDVVRTKSRKALADIVGVNHY